MQTAKCEDCMYWNRDWDSLWHEANHNLGECRRTSPTLVSEQDVDHKDGPMYPYGRFKTVGIWPLTHKDSWCGECTVKRGNLTVPLKAVV